MKNYVVFVITRVSLLSIFEGIYRKFESNEKFQPIFFIAGEPISHLSVTNPTEYYRKFPKHQLYPTHTFDSVKESCEKKGYKYILGLDYNYEYNYIDELNPSLVFYCDLYDNYYLKKEWSPLYICNYYKVIYIHYGYLLTNLISDIYNKPAFVNSWRVFIESIDHLRLIENQKGKVPNNIIYKGYPKLDLYYDRECSAIKIPDVIINEKFIIYAPHWTIDTDLNNKKTGFGNFLETYYEVIEMMKQNINLHWIFRPHPLLKAQLEFLLNERETQEIYSKFLELPNVHLYEGEDIIPLFMESEGILLDSISFMAEYIPTLKPIFFLDSGNSSLFNFIGQNVYRTTYSIDSISNASKIIASVIIDGNDVKYNERLKMAEKLLYLPTNQSKKPSELIYEQIIEDLENEIECK